MDNKQEKKGYGADLKDFFTTKGGYGVGPLFDPVLQPQVTDALTTKSGYGAGPIFDPVIKPQVTDALTTKGGYGAGPIFDPVIKPQAQSGLAYVGDNLGLAALIGGATLLALPEIAVAGAGAATLAAIPGTLGLLSAGSYTAEGVLDVAAGDTKEGAEKIALGLLDGAVPAGRTGVLTHRRPSTKSLKSAKKSWEAMKDITLVSSDLSLNDYQSKVRDAAKNEKNPALRDALSNIADDPAQLRSLQQKWEGNAETIKAMPAASPVAFGPERPVVFGPPEPPKKKL